MAIVAYPNLLYFPPSLDRDRTIMWELMGRTISGGKSLAGPQPVARLDGGGLWTARIGDVQLSSADEVRAWRAMSALLDGGATAIVLTYRDTRHYPAPTVNGVRYTTADAVTHSDGATFSDGAGYSQSTVSATVETAAALRATTIDITIAIGASLRGGEHFSIEHDTLSHRMYRIGSVTEAGGVSTCTIRPPLREAVAAGTLIEFDRPKCVMRLQEPGGMDLTLTRREFGQASTAFIESFPPWN